VQGELPALSFACLDSSQREGKGNRLDKVGDTTQASWCQRDGAHRATHPRMRLYLERISRQDGNAAVSGV
jgi:hypothetical protein